MPGAQLYNGSYNRSAISDVYGLCMAGFHVLIKAPNTEDKNKIEEKLHFLRTTSHPQRFNVSFA